MAITFAADTSRDGNTVSPLLDRITNTAGHLVVSAFAFLNQSTVTPPDPNPWAKFDPADPAIGTGGTIVFGTDETLEIWWRIATGSDPSAWTFAADPGGRYCSGGMAFEGALVGTPPITVWSSQPNASSTSVTAPGLDPDYTAGVLLFFGAASSTGTWTPPTGFTQPVSGSQPSAAAITLGFAYRIVSTGDAVADAVATLSGAATNAGILLFVPAADASPEGGGGLDLVADAAAATAGTTAHTFAGSGTGLDLVATNAVATLGEEILGATPLNAMAGAFGIPAVFTGALALAADAGQASADITTHTFAGSAAGDLALVADAAVATAATTDHVLTGSLALLADVALATAGTTTATFAGGAESSIGFTFAAPSRSTNLSAPARTTRLVADPATRSG